MVHVLELSLNQGRTKNQIYLNQGPIMKYRSCWQLVEEYKATIFLRRQDQVDLQRINMDCQGVYNRYILSALPTYKPVL
jgi:hypothetical protein